MVVSGRSIALALILPCLGSLARGQDAAPRDAAVRATQVQAGFFTPRRTGQMWDTWMYYHDGTYHQQFYLAGPANRWDGHELARTNAVGRGRHGSPRPAGNLPRP